MLLRSSAVLAMCAILAVQRPADNGPRHVQQTRSAREQRPSIPPQTDDSRQLQQTVEGVEAHAAAHGEYACCLKQACAWCAIHNGRCPCATTLGERRMVCRECHGGWEAGQGRIPGVTRDDVRKMGSFGVHAAERK